MNNIFIRDDLNLNYDPFSNTQISTVPNSQLNSVRFHNLSIRPSLTNQSIRRNYSTTFPSMRLKNPNNLTINSQLYSNYSKETLSSLNSLNSARVLTTPNISSLDSQVPNIINRSISYSGNNYRTMPNYVFPIKHVFTTIQNNTNDDTQSVNTTRSKINQLFINENNSLYSIRRNQPINGNMITVVKSIRPVPKQITILNPNYTTLNYSGMEYIDPPELLNVNEFKILKQIGTGSHAQIFCVRWIKNHKIYALKREVLLEPATLNKTIEKNNMLINFFKKTNSKGVIRVYSTYYQRYGNTFIYYELMEMAERDWEQEIFLRNKYMKFYTEIELFSIMRQLVKTMSMLQKNHITHRDVKPQNVLISNGIYKICDFGEAKVLIRDGGIVSRVRGSELYMSPVLLCALRSITKIVSHNTYKSDVFSLGMCFLLAATLTMDSLVAIREIDDMNLMKAEISRFLLGRYSYKVINILLTMLQVEENLRPTFIQLESMYFN